MKQNSCMLSIQLKKLEKNCEVNQKKEKEKE